ncbi:hypothetical protein [Actinoplanes sp. RD1]|nr:hypothetical protein [Actinoplanes sp. RD1]
MVVAGAAFRFAGVAFRFVGVAFRFGQEKLIGLSYPGATTMARLL